MQDLKCQKCDTCFKTETISGVTVKTCSKCKLVFIDGVEVTRLREGHNALSVMANPPAHGYETTSATHMVSEKCPRCEVKLRDEEYIKNSNIHFKLCSKCLSIMFDAGELDKLKNYQISPTTKIYDEFEELFPVMKKVMAG